MQEPGGAPAKTLQERVGEVPYWYHTLELGPGVVTPGFFDLRDAVDRLPWPDVSGARCLDVGTFDGFLAFELERRGADEVVAIDIEDAADLDWLPRAVPGDLERAQEPTGRGFALAKEVLGSQVRREICSVYDLTRDAFGGFDVVVCGALLQHLRDPAGALIALRSVCDRYLLSVELVDHWRSLFHRRTPLVRIVGGHRTWGLANVAGHHRLLDVCGFDVETERVVPVPFGRGAMRSRGSPWQRLRAAPRSVASLLLTGATDPPFSAVLAAPAAGVHPLPEVR